MIVIFDEDRLERLEDISVYNHNYYRLPYSIENCNYVYEEANDVSDDCEYHLGYFDKENRFIEVLSFWGDMNGEVDLVRNRI